MDVVAWLGGLGLEQYAPAFRDNDIDEEVLRRLTAEDLRELGVLIALVFGHVKTAAALTLADLQGPWQAALISSGGGCGPGTAVVNFDLDGATGTVPATFQATTRASGTVPKCSGVSEQTLTIESLDPVSNSGIGNLTCGTGCGWTFNIQVHPDGWIMNLVDVTNPRNFIEGTAIRQPHSCPPYYLQ